MDIPVKPKNRCAFICCRLVLMLSIAMAAAGVIVYYRFFKRAPVADIMARNRATLVRVTANDDYEYYEDMSNVGDSIFENLNPQSSKQLWSKFILDNRFVSIGDIYNKCGEFANRYF